MTMTRITFTAADDGMREVGTVYVRDRRGDIHVFAEVAAIRAKFERAYGRIITTYHDDRP
jgi:hypothetical protein